ncbi:MAG: ABC transporter permease, partial [Chloroflexota bacterium]
QYNLLYVTIDRDAMALARSDIDTVTDDLRDRIEQQLGLPVLGAQINRENNLWAGDFATAIASILFLVGSAALVLCCLLVVNVITGILTRQRRQVGVMKMIGATGPQIAGLYFVLVGTFGVLALVLAVPVSRLLARGVAGALLGEGFLNVNVSVFQLPLFVLIVQVTVSIAAPILAALAPIVQGARVSPIESLRDSTNANPDWIDRLLARLKGLPRPVLLTLRNTFRRKARLASTLFTLVIAGGFFMGSLNIRVSVLREAESVPLAGSDLRFTLADTYDVDGVRRRLQSVTGITFSEGWLNGSVSRSRPDGTRSDVLTLNGIPWNSPYNQPILTEGRWLTEPNSFNRRDIVISTEFASLEPDVGVGDALTLHLDGDEQTWNVVGIVETGGPTSTTPPLYTYYDSGARFLGLPRQTNFLLASTNTGSLALDRMIERQVLAELDRFDIDVAASAVVLEESENARSSFDVIIFLLAFVALLIAVVGGFGLGGTMSLSVMERTREIGVMRSVGASSSTLRGMYVLESLIIGGMSFVMALPFSLLVSYGFAVAIAGIFGRDRPLEFGINPLGFALWALIVVVVAVFASLAPAQRAAQISIREALAYE